MKDKISILRFENGNYDNITSLAITKGGRLLIKRNKEKISRSFLTKVIYAENSSSKYFSGPIKVYFDPTLVCPLECSFCLACAPEYKKLNNPIPQLDKTDLFKIAKQIVESGALQVKIGGGEPFLYKNFFPLIKYLSKNGISVSTSTNGITLSQLPKSKVNFLKKNNIKISVSIDGEEKYHNSLRDPFNRFNNIYQRAINGIEYLLLNNCRVAIRSTITNSEESLKQIDFLNNISKKYNIETRIRLAKPVYKSKSNNDSFVFKNDLYIKAFNKLRRIRKENPLINIDDIIEYDEKNNYFNCGLDCSAGTRSCFINAKGELSPCGFLDNKFSPVSLLDGKTTLSYEWKNGKSFKQIRRFFENENQTSPCSKCTFVNKCQGGCPAVRFFTKEKQDLRCPLNIQEG